MDLLASYSDDADSGKNTPILDKADHMPPKIDPSKSDMSLEAEWESFEKMIGAGYRDSSGPPPLPVAAPQMPVLTENMNLALSDPPSLTSVETPPNSANHVDPPVLSNMNEPPKITDNASMSHTANQQSKCPPKLTDISLSPEFNSDSVFRDLGNDDMPTLTKMTGSPSSTPDHSSSRSSSSSGSRSSSVESVKSSEKRRSASPVTRKKSTSPARTSSNSHRKDEKRSRRSHSRSHSPHRKRRRSSDRKRSRSRSRDKRRPSERRRRSRSRGKKSHHSSSHSSRRRRSHSRSRRRSSRDRRSSRERHRRKDDSHRRERRGRSRDRSRDRSRERDRSRDRHRRSHSRERRSRSGSPIRGRERFSRPASSKTDKKPLTFKEQMRQQLLKASKILSEQGETGELKDLELPKEKPSNLPLNATNMFSAATTGSGVTPQMALLQTMAAMHQKAQEMTGVAVPKYYNPAAVNPLKYAEQVQKRKLLWSKNKDKKEEDSQWQSTAFVQDQDGKMATKFRKLMGMKEHEEHEGEEEKVRETEEQKKKTEEMFYRLDKEYEFARMTTHTHRGVGLGFSSQGFPTPTFPQNP